MKKEADPRHCDAQHADDRSPLAVGYAWASRIIGICIVMILPVLAGIWLDRKLGTMVVFVLLGMFLGMGMAVLHLLQIVKEGKKP